MTVLCLAFSLLAALCGLVCVVLLVRKKDAGEKDELIRLSTTLTAQGKTTADALTAQRMEQNQRLEQLNVRLEKLAASQVEQQLALTQTVAKSLNDIRDRTAADNERQAKLLAESIANMQTSNEKKLEQMRATVDEKLTSTLSTRLNDSFKTVSDQLEKLYTSLGEMKELSVGVTDNVGALNRVLTNVKARGTWAEVQLESILDQTIPNMYDKNVATGEKDTERVEFAIRIPAADDHTKITYLPVDSKFPMEDYARLCSAADAADADAVKAAKKELENRVWSEAKMITKYIRVPHTTPFAIMYLATEGLYAEIVSSPSGLLERIQNECNVMVAGPSTITALLNSLSMGFKTVAINEKANEVRLLLAATKSQYETFEQVLQKAKKKIDEAGKTLDDAQHRNSIIRKKLRTVEDLDAENAEDILGISAASSSENSEI